MEAPNPACSNADQHTPCPSGYIAWHDWAASMYARGARQRQCSGCGLYVIWHGGREIR